MNEQHETNETSDEQDIKRWTAKRQATRVIESLRGQNAVAEAPRTHGLKVSVLSPWFNFYNTKRSVISLQRSIVPGNNYPKCLDTRRHHKE